MLLMFRGLKVEKIVLSSKYQVSRSDEVKIEMGGRWVDVWIPDTCYLILIMCSSKNKKGNKHLLHSLPFLH